MAQLSELNRISIAQICVYVPSLAVAVILAMRHGFGRSSGWFYLILFSIIRILGGALDLATMNDPTNISLHVGASTLQSAGVSPLILVMLGLLSRVLDSIRANRTTLIAPRHIRLVQVLVLVGLILGIVGGVQMGTSLSKATGGGNADYSVPTMSRAGLGLLIAGFCILTIASVFTGFQIGSAEPGEKRLLLAVALALPFVLVRVVYSALATYGDDPNFRSFGGSSNYTNYLLGMAVIMEMLAVAVLEGIGLTLQKVTVGRKGDTAVPLTSIDSSIRG